MTNKGSRKYTDKHVSIEIHTNEHDNERAGKLSLSKLAVNSSTISTHHIEKRSNCLFWPCRTQGCHRGTITARLIGPLISFHSAIFKMSDIGELLAHNNILERIFDVAFTGTEEGIVFCGSIRQKVIDKNSYPFVPFGQIQLQPPKETIRMPIQQSLHWM